jgi:hypothetical protein
MRNNSSALKKAEMNLKNLMDEVQLIQKRLDSKDKD